MEPQEYEAQLECEGLHLVVELGEFWNGGLEAHNVGPQCEEEGEGGDGEDVNEGVVQGVVVTLCVTAE